MAHGIDPEGLERRLAATPEAKAVFIVSPTYYGMAADVAGCAEVAHAAGAALVVDQAWGAHFGFHRDLPASALAVGADAVLNVEPQDRRLADAVGDAPTSPATRASTPTARPRRAAGQHHESGSLLLGSLDAARRQLAIHGQDLLGRTLAAAARGREAIDADRGMHRRRRRHRRASRRLRVRPVADRDRRSSGRVQRLRGGRGTSRQLRRLRRAGDPRDDRARPGHRSIHWRARALRPRSRGRARGHRPAGRGRTDGAAGGCAGARNRRRAARGVPG